jgi:DNA polymerase III epsilon subunit-like protein
MQQSILFFDTETTGLPRARNISALQCADIWPDIVSISWIVHTIHSRTPPTKHTYIIKPDGWHIPADSIRIHGITNELAQTNGRPLAEVMAKFKDAVHSARHIIAHNMEFDKNVIHHAFKWRLGTDPLLFWDSRKEFCSMLQSKNELKIPGRYPKPSDPYKNPGLDELYRVTFKGKEPPSGAHSADRDVEVLYQIVANRWRIL